MELKVNLVAADVSTCHQPVSLLSGSLLLLLAENHINRPRRKESEGEGVVRRETDRTSAWKRERERGEWWGAASRDMDTHTLRVVSRSWAATHGFFPHLSFSFFLLSLSVGRLCLKKSGWGMHTQGSTESVIACVACQKERLRKREKEKKKRRRKHHTRLCSPSSPFVFSLSSSILCSLFSRFFVSLNLSIFFLLSTRLFWMARVSVLLLSPVPRLVMLLDLPLKG